MQPTITREFYLEYPQKSPHSSSFGLFSEGRRIGSRSRIAFLGENVVQALSFTAAVAICFATIGRNNPLAATQFSLLTSATVIPILYMGLLDGRVYDSHGLARMYLIDGGLSISACIIMATVMWLFARRSAISPTAS